MRWDVVAEDGNLYDHSRDQHAAFLPAGKTRDATIVPTTDGTYAVYDGLLGLGNGDSATGGMLKFLTIAP